MAVNILKSNKNYLRFKQASGTSHSVDWTVDDDGVITLNGLADGTGAYNPISCYVTLPAGDYTFTSLNQADAINTHQLYASWQDGSGDNRGTGSLNKHGTTTFTLTQTTTIRFYCFFYGGNNYDHLKIYPMVIEGTYTYETVPSFVKSVGRLPSAYQEVEYITSDGNQLINTNVKLATNSKYQFEIKFTSNDDVRWFGNYQNGSNDLVLAFKNGYIPCRINQQWDDNYLTTISLNQKHLIEVETNSAGIKIYCDGVLHKEVSIAYAPNTNLNIGLLKEYSSTKPSLIGDLYSCKMWVNDVLTRNYISSTRKSDNTIGLYDLANDTFYYNSGSGSFTVGTAIVGYDIQKMKLNLLSDRVRLPAEYEEVEYLQSSGTQYIDTEVSPDNNTGLKVIFSNLTIDNSDFNFIGCRLYGSSRFMINCTNRNFGYGWDSYYTTNESINASVKNTAELNFYNNRHFIANGNTLDNLSTIEISNMPTICIFGQHVDNNYNLYSYKVYECEITQDDLLIRKFVPCYRKSDFVAGFYDMVSRTFFTNAGTGSFIAGPRVNLPDEYQEVEWIKGQIDTGEIIIPGDTEETWEYTFYAEYIQADIIGNSVNGGYIQMFFTTQSDSQVVYFYFGYNNGKNSISSILNKKIIVRINKKALANDDTERCYYTFIDAETNETLISRYTYKPAGGTQAWIDARPKLYIKPAFKTYGFKKIGGKELVPCYRKSDSTVGMYDITNNEFIAATGTTDKGNDIPKYKIQPVKMNLLKETLPSEYQKVEYIESDGNQYIDTGVIPNNTTSLKTKLSGITASSAHLLGSRTAASNKAFTLSIINSTNSTTIGFNDNVFNYPEKLSNIEATIGTNSIINGTSHTFSSTVWEGEYSIYLFRMNEAGSLHSALDSFKMYYCQIYNNNMLVRKFIPCYRKSDNVIGMYDLSNSGKNLFDTSTITKDYRLNPTTGENVALNGFAISDKIYVEPNKTYTISTYNDAGTNVANSGFRVIIYNSNNQVLSVPVDTQTRLGTRSVWTFTIPSNGAYIKFSYRRQSDTQNPPNNDYNIQFEEGSTATTYEPFAFYTNAGTGTFLKGNDIPPFEIIKI